MSSIIEKFNSAKTAVLQIKENITESNLGKYVFNKNTLGTVAAIVLIAAGIALFIIGMHQLHMKSCMVRVDWDYFAATILTPFGHIKTFALLCGGGAALGTAIFVIKKIVFNKMHAALAEKKIAWLEQAVASERLINAFLAITMAIAAATILGLVIHYVNHLPAAYSVDSWLYLGHIVNPHSVKLAVAGVLAAGAMGILSLLEVANFLATRHKKVAMPAIPNLDPSHKYEL